MSAGPLAFTPLTAVGAPLRAQALTLSPHEGQPGTRVSVTGTGFEVCGQATLTFDGGHATPATVHAPEISGTIVVPQDATAGPDHTIEAACDSGNAYHAEAPFTVTSGGGTTPGGSTTPAETPTLTLDPGHGSIGTKIAVQGKGFAQCSAKSVHLYVVNGPDIAPAIPVTENGDFSYTEVIPEKTSPNTYTFRAACTSDPASYADASLVVESPAANPVLTLTPQQGAQKAKVRADGTGFTCAKVDFQWDGAEPFATTAVAEPGTFTTEITVPADARPGEHTVRAVCADHPEQYGESPFTVSDNGGTNNGGTNNGGTGNGGTDNGGTNNGGTDNGGTNNGGTDNGGTNNGGTDNGGTNNGGTGNGGTGNGGTDTGATTGGGTVNSGTVGWVVGSASLGGAVVLAAAAAVYFGRLHRGPRWVRGHVRATLRPATATAELTELRAPGEPPTRTIRLDPHADPGSATIDEVDR
ncbi:hypothetical protein AB0G73_21730 [Streptomyces sp. NPDC020719]|uniref:hypothetical protein n=1 Tax=Streptomyces sp. NPDC020719 TaxID=3154896 RepID=UPI0033F8D592